MPVSDLNYQELAEKIKLWGQSLGFQKVGISDIDLSKHEAGLQAWLDKGYHGSMDYMERHGMMRARPDELVPGTVSIISVRMDYLPPNAEFAKTLKDDKRAYISRYAVGRDYHKVVRKKLKQLGQKIVAECGEFGFRPFVDSAPILERQVAEKAGLGWTGKHSLLLDKSAGSWFFLGELLVDIPLPPDQPVQEECGKCVACITTCPTGAIVEPYVVDGRRCISYLTIESKEAIPEAFRKAMGNRIYGCDDCQLICPWNRFSQTTEELDFHPRKRLHQAELVDLFSWDEETFLSNTEGSPIRRIGYESWQRNIAVALGNAHYSEAIIALLSEKKGVVSDMVDEHIDWALEQQASKQALSIAVNRPTQRLVKSIEKGLPRDA